MKPTWTLLGVVFAFFIAVGTLVSRADTPPERGIAITIDDLPAGAANRMSAAEITEMTTKLLATLREQKIPVVGFVNERKLYFKWDEVDERIKALTLWLDSGFELGNHTYGHTSLNRAGLKDFEDAVIQGESVTRLLLTQHHMTLRYFRHPGLDVCGRLRRRQKARRHGPAATSRKLVSFVHDYGVRLLRKTLEGPDRL
jgi:peptidoglycan/xylan/chitin deacetylase (PgdA/CDA1 family)